MTAPRTRTRTGAVAAAAAAVLVVVLAVVAVLVASEDQTPVAAPAPTPREATSSPAPATPEPAPEPRAPVTFRPTTMKIPALGVTAPMDPEVPDANNVLGVPSDPKRLGWREAGALPGADQGTLLAYGHVVNRGYGRGALYYLRELAVGDDIVLLGDQGERVTYRVVKSSIVHKADMPASEMLALDGPHRLALYTCEGAPDATGHRQQRVVVWAEQASAVEGV